MAAAKKAKAKATPSAASGGRGKRKAPPAEPPQQGLLKWFGKSGATSDAASAGLDSQGSGLSEADVATALTPVTPSQPAASQQSTEQVARAGSASNVCHNIESDDEVPPPVTQPLAGQDQHRGQGLAERQDFAQAWSSDRFSQVESRWVTDYNSMYRCRLRQLRPCVEAQARTMWPQAELLPALRGYSRGGPAGADIVLVGVLFKEMRSRPNLGMLYHDFPPLAGSLLPDAERVGPGSLRSDSDVAWLEDETMRIELVVNLDWCAELVTGLVIALRGRPDSAGRFRVQSLSLAKTPLPPPLTLSPGESPAYLALICGLSLGAAGAEGLQAARDRAVDLLLHDKRVQRVIICGGLLAPELLDGGMAEDSVKLALEDTDSLLARLAGVLPVDVMPGQADPSNASLPQQPLHPYLFKKVRACRSFRSVSNPYECSLPGGFRVLGHSGQPVTDLLRCVTKSTSPLKALQTSLEALHLAPTAPDSLAVQPCSQGDPFVIGEVPHVLFSGGHDTGAHRWFAPTQPGVGTMLVCVPAFHKSPVVTLVNLRAPSDVQVLRCDHDEPRT